ncbi:lipopolysaccharide biosynthesis protein [Alkalicoccus saliphilus]|nr:oligosaccharide flippase family protein [Alkalicoccus saliphilus]
MWNKWKKSKFVRQVLVLFSGTAFAQLITIAVVPILTRLYTPDAFGTLSIYTSVVAILTIFMTMKYEYAIVTADRRKEAVAVMYVILLILLSATVLLYIVIFLFGELLLGLFQIEKLGSIIWLIPISLVFLGAMAVLKYWMNREEEYGVLSYTNISNNGSRALTQIVLGFFTASPLGLVAGQMFGNFFNAAMLWKSARKNTPLPSVEKPTGAEMREAAWKFRQFPKFNAPNTLVNNLANNSPPLLLAYFFGPAFVGLYYMSVRLIKMPVNIFAQSLGQVFLKKATAIHQDNRSVLPAYAKVTGVLAGAGIVPVIVFVLFAPPLFSFALGAEWEGAGEIARWVILWHFFIFIREPALKIIIIRSWQRFLLVVNTTFTTIGILALVFGGMYLGAMDTVILYSVIGAVSNILVIAGTFFGLLKEKYRP